jgi:hypothetical protein
METEETLYFDEPGPSNTNEILKLSRKRIEALGIHHVIIAAQTGFTVRRFLEITEHADLDILAVTNPKGAKMPVSNLYSKYEESKRIKEGYLRKGIQHFQAAISDETLREFEREGVKVLYLPDILSIGGKPPELDEEREFSESDEQRRLMRSRLNPFVPGHLRPLDIEAGADLSLLNIISMGFRVCVGITSVSVRNGFVPEGEIVLSIAGTGFAGGGADTAVVLQARSNPKACLVIEILGFPKLK